MIPLDQLVAAIIAEGIPKFYLLGDMRRGRFMFLFRSRRTHRTYDDSGQHHQASEQGKFPHSFANE
jgi:hypothetical protein